MHTRLLSHYATLSHDEIGGGWDVLLDLGWRAVMVFSFLKRATLSFISLICLSLSSWIDGRKQVALLVALLVGLLVALLVASVISCVSFNWSLISLYFTGNWIVVLNGSTSLESYCLAHTARSNEGGLLSLSSVEDSLYLRQLPRFSGHVLLTHLQQQLMVNTSFFNMLLFISYLNTQQIAELKN